MIGTILNFRTIDFEKVCNVYCAHNLCLSTLFSLFPLKFLGIIMFEDSFLQTFFFPPYHDISFFAPVCHRLWSLRPRLMPQANIIAGRADFSYNCLRYIHHLLRVTPFFNLIYCAVHLAHSPLQKLHFGNGIGQFSALPLPNYSFTERAPDCTWPSMFNSRETTRAII